jgi:hypothetical protein
VGEASHDAYKRRQRMAVYNRLRLGARQSLTPGDTPSAPRVSEPLVPPEPPPPALEESPVEEPEAD